MAKKKLVRRSTLLGELRRIKRQTKDAGDRIILDWAMRAVHHATGSQRADVGELERIFGLVDPR